MSARALALVAIAVASVRAHAAAPPPEAHAIADRLRVVGAKATVAELDDKEQLDAVLDRIGQGSAAWIALAPDLATGTDGASSEGLAIELARALPRNPLAVLRVASSSESSVVGIKKICGLPFIEATIVSNTIYRRKALAAVSKVHDLSLKVKRNQCLDRLKSS